VQKIIEIGSSLLMLFKNELVKFFETRCKPIFRTHHCTCFIYWTYWSWNFKILENIDHVAILQQLYSYW